MQISNNIQTLYPIENNNLDDTTIDIYTWQMEMLGFRAKEKDLILGKILQECKCISKCFNDEVDFILR